MADQAQSIVEHDKTVNQVGEKRSSIDQELFGELSDHALRSSITEEILFSSLAEYLAAKGLGFAVGKVKSDPAFLHIEALFAPNGTNHTPNVCSPHMESEPDPRIRLIADLTDDLKQGGVLFMSSIDEIVIEGSDILRQAFGADPVMVTRLPGSRGSKEILILCGKCLDDKWMVKAKDLAGKLSSALDINRLQPDQSDKGNDYDWISTYSKEGHLLIDAQGDIKDVNQQAIELLGLTREDLIRKNVNDVIPGSMDLVDPSKLSTQVSPHVIEVDYQSQGDHVRYLHVERHPGTVDEKSETLLKIRDLSERWRQEDMIRQLQQLTTHRKNDPSVGVFLQDSYGNFVHVNETAIEMFGYSLEYLRSKPWTTIVPEDQRYKVNQAHLRRMRGESGHYEIQLLHEGGRRLDVLVSESPYYANGRYAGAFVFITDLTTLRQAEAIVLRQNWKLQCVIDRFVAQNQRSTGSLQTFDTQELLGQIGDELHQMAIACLVATFDPNDPSWKIQYVTPHLPTMKTRGGRQELDLSSPLKVDLTDPSLILLQSGEVIFLDEPDPSIESQISRLTPFPPFLEGEKIRPRILAPLKTTDQLFGVMVLCGEHLTPEDIPAITTFANHLSIALEKSRLVSKTLSQAKLGQALADIVSASSQEKDTARLLQDAGKRILEAVHLQVCTFCFIEESGESLNVLLSATTPGREDPPPVPAPGRKIKLDEFPIIEGVLRTGRKAILPDSRQPFFGEDEKFTRAKRCQTLLLPMRALDHCFGLVSFPLEDGEWSLSADEELFLQTSVDQISLAVEERQQAALEDLKAQMDRDLSSLIAQILASRDLEEVVETGIKGVADLLPCHFVCLAIFNHTAKTAQVIGVLGGDSTTVELGDVKPLEEWDGISDLMDGRVFHYEVSNEEQPSSSLAYRLFQQGSKSWLSFPLKVKGEIIGALSIASGQANIATPENMDIASTIQTHLATALINARNHTETRNHAKEMAALVDLADEISEETDLRSLLRTAIGRTSQILDATMGAIFLADRSTEEITLVAEFGLPVPPAVLRLQIGQGLAGKVWEKKGAIILNKSRDFGDPNWLEACYATGSAIGVPLLREGQVRGVIALYSPGEGNCFDLHDIDILSKVAAQITVSIENVEELEKTVRSVNQLRVVNDVARRMSTILVEDLLYTEIVRRVAHGLNLDLVILFMVEEDRITEVASYYLPQDIYGIWEPITLRVSAGGVIGWVAGEGQPILVPDVSSDPSYLPKIPIDTKVQSVVGIPLKLKGEVTGVLLVGSEKLAAFDKADVDALLALGAHISTCIENARLYEETKEVQHRLAESEKLRALGLVTGGIAHDFNNVLSVILSRAELALKHTDDEQVRRHLEQVITSAKEGGETIHRLEGFASTEKDRTEFIGVDINRIVQEAMEICKSRWEDQAEDEGIDIQIITELHADQPILGVPSELREVLVNLIFNALEAIPAGGSITIETDNRDNGISLIVSDDGVGMTPEMKQQVFVPFFTSKPGRGGLGLSMCYGILQRHGGTIDIQSGIGEGTTITIWLPTYAKVGLEDEASQATLIPALVDPAIILVVEDEKPILEGLVETFADAGHKVLAASNGLEGFELFLEAGKMDIVFTDLGLPKLSGWELIEQLRAFDPKLPIVVFSGWGDVINPMKLRQYGIAKVIRKPFEMAKLHSTLYEVLSMRKKLDPS